MGGPWAKHKRRMSSNDFLAMSTTRDIAPVIIATRVVIATDVIRSSNLTGKVELATTKTLAYVMVIVATRVVIAADVIRSSNHAGRAELAIHGALPYSTGREAVARRCGASRRAPASRERAPGVTHG
jgi:hypothetical protein